MTNLNHSDIVCFISTDVIVEKYDIKHGNRLFVPVDFDQVVLPGNDRQRAYCFPINLIIA